MKSEDKFEEEFTKLFASKRTTMDEKWRGRRKSRLGLGLHVT